MPETPSGDMDIVIYTTMWCPYCHRAKDLLTKKGVKFHEIDVTYDPKTRAEMSARAAGRTSVPQIFIKGEAVGGSDELQTLDATGQLDRLLGRAA